MHRCCQDFETLPQLNTQRDTLYRQLQKNERDIQQLQKLEEIGQRIVEEKKALSLAKRSAALSQLLLHRAQHAAQLQKLERVAQLFSSVQARQQAFNTALQLQRQAQRVAFRCRLPTWHSSCRKVSPVQSAALSITLRPPRCRHPASQTSRSSS